MIDFHTHTIFSDGVLIPSELVRRAEVCGYRAIGLTDHVDASNLDFVVSRIVKVAKELNRRTKIFVIPGVEITHAPPDEIAELIAEARNLGAALIITHGESPVEPVAPGTNHAAILAETDILAHPGLLSTDDAILAKQKKVFLEITSRAGHSLTNGHVFRVASETGAQLVLSTDTHTPDNLITPQKAELVLRGSGMSKSDASRVLDSNQAFLDILKARMAC
ncbi:MAG: histidinol phosphate phosphatase domain-containing protein [Deltaproteobacteria bacterium]|nr:histidinol phosphate phosphatase domain-containing protein [Deltaproteobacteria bacterium]